MRFLLTTAALISILASSTSAQSIDINDGPPACDDVWLSINNQTQLDFYRTCRSFDDVIFVGHTFVGPFELPGVESVGRISAGYYLPKLKGSTRVDDAVTKISFPDLKNTTISWNGGVFAAYLDFLEEVEFPKLENVTGDLIFLDNPKLKKLEFPALKNVSGGIVIDGYFDEISFPSLTHVGFMNVKAGSQFDCVALGKNLSSLTFTATKKPLGGDFGLTCWTGYANNRWNSSDPEGNPQSSPSGTGTATGSASTSTSTSGSNASGSSSGGGSSAASALQILGLNVVLASVGTAIIGGLLM